MENILNNNNDVRIFLNATNGLNKSKDKLKILKIDKHLPQIIVPENKIQMFIDWWNSDIRFEKSIPHSFDEGYMIIDTGEYNRHHYSSAEIKALAIEYHTTYRYIENIINDFFKNVESFTLYFKFTSDNSMFVETYGKDGKIISNMEFAVGENSDYEKPIDFNTITASFGIDYYVRCVNYINLGILISCLWYIATTKKSTKYVYEKRVPQVVGRQKGVVQVSDTKFISTPIYDIGKTRTVKVEHLQKRKKGWTYSHAFQVHGHYRHYKDGKVIFINPYIKGKDKEFKAQQFILTPEDVNT